MIIKVVMQLIIYKELNELNNDKTNNPVKKWTKSTTRQFLNGELQMTPDIWKMLRTSKQQGNANVNANEVNPHSH